MRQKFFKTNSKPTLLVKLSSQKCIACWECINVCPKNVIGRVDLPWHKHAKLSNTSNCIACFKCVKVCKASAIHELPKSI